MERSGWERRAEAVWEHPATGRMRVPAVIFASEELLDAMDDKVAEQACNVATLPGIVKASFVMPDGHWGYGFPIGGVAAFDPAEGGVVSAGGVGFDISCGVRMLLTGLDVEAVESVLEDLADVLQAGVPAGVGSQGAIVVKGRELDELLREGARWAVARGYGVERDLERIEEGGRVPGARPECVSDKAKERQRRQVGTLGSGNHYLEVQAVVEIHDEKLARAFGLRLGEVVVSIHCGSRGLGHQIGTDYLKEMVTAARGFGIEVPDRELACAPLTSELGRRYLGAMRAGANCALANRQVITHLVREGFRRVLPEASLDLLYDVSHNTCKEEVHLVDGSERRLFVHRKGATRAFPPGHPELPEDLRAAGQPVIVGGTMGTSSFVLAGRSESPAFASACHGAGRSMSRHKATKTWHGGKIVAELRQRGILIRSPSLRGVAEEAPGAYKDVEAVAEASERAGLARRVARVRPLLCVKG